MRSSIVACALWLAAASLVGTAILGFAHTTAGKPLLGWLMATTGCPVTLDGADPISTERYRVEQLSRRVGEGVARSRPALEFELGLTTSADVDRWVATHHLECERVRDGSVLRCERVSTPDTREAVTGLAVSHLHLQFDAQERLVAVDLFREATAKGAARAAAEHIQRTERALSQTVGAVTHRHGEATAHYLSEQAMRRVSRGYHYNDYVATVSATWLGTHARLREQYQWLPPSSVSPQLPGG